MCVELKELSLKASWVELDARCNYWKHANQTFRELDCDPELAADFFQVMWMNSFLKVVFRNSGNI